MNNIIPQNTSRRLLIFLTGNNKSKDYEARLRLVEKRVKPERETVNDERNIKIGGIMETRNELYQTIKVIKYSAVVGALASKYLCLSFVKKI